MVVPNSLFDVLLFGVLAIALALDVLFGAQLHGVATVLAVGLATYLTAQELSRTLTRRQIWTQESLATAVALSAAGFLYYWGRNDADVILVVLSLGFMMTSLMMLIAIVAAIAATLHGKGLSPIFGWIATFVGALVLGSAAGMLILVLTSGLSWPLRLALLAIGFALAKMRELSKKAPQNAALNDVSSTRSAAQNADEAARTAAVHAGGWTLVPERGTLLERFVPILVIGALAFIFLAQTRHNAAWPSTPAQASTSPANSTVAPQ